MLADYYYYYYFFFKGKAEFASLSNQEGAWL